MNVAGTGTEIVECLRIGKMIEQHGESFLRRIYTENEIDFCSARSRATQHYAAYWAAKNAVLRSLGLKMQSGISWRDIEIRPGPGGKSLVGLAGIVRDASVAQSIEKIHISLSSSRTMAVGFAVAIRNDESPFHT